MKTFCIGDVHGSGQELEKLLEKMSPSSSDKIMLVGDCFDRALHADRVWKAIEKYNISVCMGNHEVKMIAFLEGRFGYLPPHYYAAFNILQERAHLAPNQLLTWLKSLPLLVDFGDFMVTHAGVRLDNTTLEDVSANVYGSLPPDEAMPIPKAGDGRQYWWDGYKQDKLVIYGHLVTVDNLPRIRYGTNKKVNSIGLDTAACHGGPLTGVSIEGSEIIYYSHKSGVDWSAQLKQSYKTNPVILNDEYADFRDTNFKLALESLPEKR